MKVVFNAIFKKFDNWWSVEFPDVPAAQTQGETIEEALEMAQDALSAIIATGRKGREYTSPRSFEEVLALSGENDYVFPVTPDEKIIEEYRPKKRVNIMVPVSLLSKIDAKVKTVTGMDRSKFLCDAAESYIN